MTSVPEVRVRRRGVRSGEGEASDVRGEARPGHREVLGYSRSRWQVVRKIQ